MEAPHHKREKIIQKYEEKEHIIFITQDGEETTIECIRDSKCYKISMNLKDIYFYLDPFKEIISEFKNNQINIKKSDNEDELKIKFKKIFNIKNINSFTNNDKECEKKEINGYETKFYLEEKKLYILVNDKNDNNKSYIFLIESQDIITEKMLNEFIKLMEDKFELKKENQSMNLYIEYTFDHILKYINNQGNNIKDETNKGNKNISEFKELCKEIKDIFVDPYYSDNRTNNLINEIEKKHEKLKSDMKAMLNNIKVMKENAELLIFPKKKLIPPKKEAGVEMDSYIITKKNDFDFINKRLIIANEGGEVEYELIYRASRDRDLAKIFKEKCEYIRGTLIVVKTEEKEKIFGGYTTQVWDDSEKNYDDEKAFCFSINKRKIYELREYCSAIGCDIGSGPRFCYMFMIMNKFMTTPQQGEVYKKELSHYDNQENDYELNDGDQWFTVKEMEVFKISPK